MNDNVRYAEKINELVAIVNTQTDMIGILCRFNDDLLESRWFRMFFRAYLRKLPPQRRYIAPMDVPPVFTLSVEAERQRDAQLAGKPYFVKGGKEA